MKLDTLFNTLEIIADIASVVSPLDVGGPLGEAGPAVSRFARETGKPKLKNMGKIRFPKYRPPVAPRRQRIPFEDIGWKPGEGAPKTPHPKRRPGQEFPGSGDLLKAVKQASNRKAEGKTIEQWDAEWFSIGMLRDADLTPYGHCVGLYRHVIDGETMYVGRAIELFNGGFRKRLSDYRRDSDSARPHTSGRLIHEHLDEIETYLLVVGCTPEAVKMTVELEKEFIQLYAPAWNIQHYV